MANLYNINKLKKDNSCFFFLISSLCGCVMCQELLQMNPKVRKYEDEQVSFKLILVSSKLTGFAMVQQSTKFRRQPSHDSCCCV